MNQLILTASIEEVSTLRYTPAGLPALNLTLTHASEVEEASLPRQVKVSVKAVAIGSVAESIGKQAVGSSWQFKGFLGAALRGKSVVFHIQTFKPI
ncbi:MAG TPA: primosomal replication protein N [Burkholderiaceae bacterium]|nr:primosomal replication protein N [Polaromonas sp.]HRH05160.1 primosomal replication protein N [Burkholderiaceae bacterium]